MSSATGIDLATYGVNRSTSVWATSFAATERTQLLRDDLLAGRSVSLVLASVVSLGLLGLALIVLAGMPSL